MEKFGQDRYTNQCKEVHPKIIETIQREIGISLSEEIFISAIWTENMFTKGEIFTVVLNDRVIYKFIGMQQNYYSSITGIENSIYYLTVLSAGNKTELFTKGYNVKKEIVSKVFYDINTAFNKFIAKNDKNDNDSPIVKKLYSLYKDGVLTEEELNRKVKELLEKEI